MSGLFGPAATLFLTSLLNKIQKTLRPGVIMLQF